MGLDAPQRMKGRQWRAVSTEAVTVNVGRSSGGGKEDGLKETRLIRNSHSDPEEK